jgi:hypothetical protein
MYLGDMLNKDSTGSVQGKVTVLYEHSNEPSGSITAKNFFTEDCCLLGCSTM